MRRDERPPSTPVPCLGDRLATGLLAEHGYKGNSVAYITDPVCLPLLGPDWGWGWAWVEGTRGWFENGVLAPPFSKGRTLVYASKCRVLCVAGAFSVWFRWLFGWLVGV